MKILVYGAGVLGGYLAHVLVRGGNDVTVLARGRRAEQLEQDGLHLRHYFQRKTTVDRVNVIRMLPADDSYELIFVVMKYNDFPSVLPALAENRSSTIVLVGNNADARAMQDELQEKSAAAKNVVFGFQLSGGLREDSGRIICIRGGGQMVLGGLDGEVSCKPLLERAFQQVKYKLMFHADMDAWLKNHIIPILALNTVGYLHDGDLKRASRDNVLLRQAVVVMGEGFGVLERLGYTLTPAAQARWIRKYTTAAYWFLNMYHRLPVAKYVDGSFSEIAALFDAFGKLKQNLTVPTPNWDEFEERALAKFALENRGFVRESQKVK